MNIYFVALLGALYISINSALAQGVVVPAPGLWEVKTMMKAGLMKKSPPSDQRCLLANAAENFEQFFVTPVQVPGDDVPECRLSNVQRREMSSAWLAECVGPRGKMEGLGEAKYTHVSYTSTQTFKMGSMRMRMTIQAKHLGPC